MQAKSKKRTQPRLTRHRVALELSKQKDSSDKLIDQAEKRFVRVLKAQIVYNNWVENQIENGIIKKSNESLDPKDQTDTLTIFASDGSKKLYLGRSARRSLDGRAQRAMALIDEWLKEKEATLEMDEDSSMIYEFLKAIFFGSRKKQFRWTPQLMDFITMNPIKIHDKRLREAQELLKVAIRIDKSKWTIELSRFDDAQNEYIKIDIDNFEELGL